MYSSVRPLLQRITVACGAGDGGGDSGRTLCAMLRATAACDCTPYSTSTSGLSRPPVKSMR
jgi:hypothetical protein